MLAYLQRGLQGRVEYWIDAVLIRNDSRYPSCFVTVNVWLLLAALSLGLLDVDGDAS